MDIRTAFVTHAKAAVLKQPGKRGFYHPAKNVQPAAMFFATSGDPRCNVAPSQRLTVHLDEVRPGLGNLDFRVLLMQLDRLGPDLPLLMEHMQQEADFLAAAEYIRGEAQEVGVSL